LSAYFSIAATSGVVITESGKAGVEQPGGRLGRFIRTPEYNFRRIEEVRHRLALAQKLGMDAIGARQQRRPSGECFDQLTMHMGKCRRAYKDRSRPAGARPHRPNQLHDRQQLARVDPAIRPRRRADAHQHQIGAFQRAFLIRGGENAPGGVGLGEKLCGTRLNDRAFAGRHPGRLLGRDINADERMPELRQAGHGRRADIPKTENHNAHKAPRPLSRHKAKAAPPRGASQFAP
jgi:hypothetical protein